MTLHERCEVIARKMQEAGCFVLLTNVPTQGEMAHRAGEVLRAYKEQHGVEQNFAFLKDPVIVNSLFLKKPERIEALEAVLKFLTPVVSVTLIGSRALSQLHPDSISIMWLLNFHGSNLMNSELTSCALKAFIHRGLWHFPNPASGRKIYLTWDKTSSPLVSTNPL